LAAVLERVRQAEEGRWNVVGRNEVSELRRPPIGGLYFCSVSPFYAYGIILAFGAMADTTLCVADVRFWPLADMRYRTAHVRFDPKANIRRPFKCVGSADTMIVSDALGRQ